MELPETVRTKMGSFLIGNQKDSLNIEFISCKLVMAAFKCQSVDALVIGDGAFQKLSLKGAAVEAQKTPISKLLAMLAPKV